MKGIARWSVENRVPVNLLMVVFVVGGLIAFNGIHREVFPLFALRLVTITTSYPGVSPAELEQLVTIPVENAVAEVDGVTEVRSSTTEGLSVVIAELEDDIDNLAAATQDIESAVDAITTMPPDAEDPRVAQVKLEFPVIDVAVSGTAAETERRAAAKLLKRRLERIQGISSVAATGLREREIWVEIDPNRLYGLNLSLDLVLARLRQRLVNVPAGSLKTERGEVLLRTSGTTTDAERLESITIRTAADGHHIRLSDIGTVTSTFEEARTVARANGYPAINLHVVKQGNGDTIQIVKEVRALIEELKPAVADGVELFLINDGSVWIANRLRTMYQSGLWGLALVLLVLNVFLNPRIAAMTAFGLPLAVSGGLIVLYISGGSLNMLSLFAFILVLGILVDDAIVISENSYRYMQHGMEPARATILGTKEVALPVIAGVTTTIAAFLPLLMTSGVMGEFLKIVPIVAVACLTGSLTEALVILPSHLADFTRGTGDTVEHHRTPRWFRRLRRVYNHTVASAVRYRYVTLMLILLVAAGAAILTSRMRFVFLDDSAATRFEISVKTPPSNALEDTEEVIQQAERIALAFPTNEIKSVVSSVGTLQKNQRAEFGPYLGQINVELADFDLLPRDGTSIFRDMREQLQQVTGAESIELERQTGGPPVGRPVYVQILGEDLGVLQKIAGEIKEFLAGVPGIHDISDSFVEGKDEIRVETDESRAGLYGLSVDSIGRTVRTAMDGTVVATVQEEDEDIDVRVRYQPRYRRTLADIATLRISTAAGELIPFGNAAELRRTRGLGRIDREGRERVIAVSADVDAAMITSVAANAMVARKFADIGEHYPGYSLDFGGEAEETAESLQSLSRAFIVAMLVIYSILGGMFKSFSQPMVVLFAIPFSLIGVILGFFLSGTPLSFMALFGVIALAGVVVNDSLLLVHFINGARRSGVPLVRAVAISAKRRFRPVILTSLTTIAGVLPLSLVSTGQAAFLAPMATAIVWGLAFSTFLTLLLVPSLYLINEDILKGLRRLFGGAPHPSGGKTHAAGAEATP
ncbi:MAG: efflux RND transporter permease subunit [Acidobacteriota bacterium]